jgi:hypothetical protein
MLSDASIRLLSGRLFPALPASHSAKGDFNEQTLTRNGPFYYLQTATHLIALLLWYHIRTYLWQGLCY